jgi:hypothetical protein
MAATGLIDRNPRNVQLFLAIVYSRDGRLPPHFETKRGNTAKLDSISAARRKTIIKRPGA